MSDLDYLHRRISGWVFHASINEFQGEHAHERVDQGLNNLGGFPTAPDRRQSEQADQVVNAALKALDLLGGLFGLRFHVRPPSRA